MKDEQGRTKFLDNDTLLELLDNPPELKRALALIKPLSNKKLYNASAREDNADVLKMAYKRFVRVSKLVFHLIVNGVFAALGASTQDYMPVTRVRSLLLGVAHCDHSGGL